jgi:hypothetical protein
MENRATRFQPEDVRLLAWKFLDGCADQAEQQQLAGCLQQDEAARSIYLQCVQLHVDLLCHFSDRPLPQFAAQATTKKKEAPLGIPAVSTLPPMNTPTPF